MISFTLPVNVNFVPPEPKCLVKEVCEFSKVDISKLREDLFFSPINMSDLTSVDQAVEI